MKEEKMKAEELKEILKKHQHWLNEDCDGWRMMRADLYGADLRGANLRAADLQEANLYAANLYGADLYGADLRGADLQEANLYGADLRGANLRAANLYAANLYAANLYGADLRVANLRGADLHGANLQEANLYKAALDEDKKIIKGTKLTTPIVGWKKCSNGVIVKLEIPRGAIVFSINNSKCRTDRARVLDIVGANRAYSKYKHFSYYKGDIIQVYNFNCEYNAECAEGIHFFRNRKEAEEYGA